MAMIILPLSRSVKFDHPSINCVISKSVMKSVHISGLDVATLRALLAIHKRGSLSRAAEQLGVTQSTLSHTLKRLRAAFGDELFVRHGRGVVPTERCDALVAGVRRLLDQLADLAEPPSFEAATSAHRFTLSCNFYERFLLLPHLVREFRNQAPAAQLNVIQSNLRGHEQLNSGQCDVLISPLLAETSGLYRRSVMADRYACFVDRAHPLAKAPLTLENYAAANHIAVNYDGGWRPFYRNALDALGVSITPRIELPSFGAIGSILEGSDLILTAPAALASVLLPKAVMIEPPFAAEFEVFMFWTARQHDSPANGWLRHLVAETVRSARASAD
ncbi:MAG: LysR family transcriptional regulator [Devosia sp.]